MTVPCSSFVDEPLPGTATQERGWLCIESNAGWGRDPVSGDTFPNGLGRQIEALAERYDLRVLLIRRPGRAAFRTRYRVFVARSVAGDTWLRQFEIDDYERILSIDLGDPHAGIAADPIALVCTNGKRDVCCATLGRPLVALLASCYADPVVWECSHTGGHRFAPVLIMLPSGYTYGRVTASEAKKVFDAARAGLVSTVGLRGRSSTSPVAQVADVAVRRQIPPCAPDALRIATDGAVAMVRGAGGQWRVSVDTHDLPPRVASCGKAPSPARAWRVTEFDAL